MKQVTVRMPLLGHERLARFCARYGVSVRATFEASTMITLADATHPTYAPLIEGLWDISRRLAASDLFAPGLRSTHPRIVVRLENDLHRAFRETCRRHGLTATAAWAVVPLPWPADTPPEILDYRTASVTPRVVEIASRLDAVRRASQVSGLIPFPAGR